MDLAKGKLLDGLTMLRKQDESCDSSSLACLSVRFALEIYRDETFHKIARTQVECHMRLYLSATREWDK